jgi:hypothetical protein
LHCSILIQKTYVKGRNTAEITKELQINSETGLKSLLGEKRNSSTGGQMASDNSLSLH